MNCNKIILEAVKYGLFGIVITLTAGYLGLPVTSATLLGFLAIFGAP